MELTYDRLRLEDLRGTTQADYLTAIDAHLCITEARVAIFDEPGFPVVELAWRLLMWLSDSDSDFVFDSMSYEEKGMIAIRRVADRWTISSVFAPEVATTPAEHVEVEECCRRFIERVATDLEALGLDSAEVLTW